MSRRSALIAFGATIALLAVTAGGLLAFGVIGGASDGRQKTRVVLYGDSLSVESGRHVRSTLRRADSNVEFANRSFPGTAPCDWFQRASVDAERKTFAVIVEAFGNNQSKCQLTEAGNRPRSEGDLYWRRYRTDLRKLIAMFPDTTKIFLTAPPAAYNDDSAGKSHSRRMLMTMRKAALGFRNVRVVNAGKAVETTDGQYTRSLPCLRAEPECTNQPKRGFNLVRAEDGIHFCPPVLKATVESLARCPVYSSGAWRFGRAQAEPVASLLTKNRRPRSD
ncbi:MAG: hypothetical protein WCO96_00315 [Actinomycetes bacterium]